jgi:hypothetical protein
MKLYWNVDRWVQLWALIGMSNFSRFKCFALTPNAVGFLQVWIRQRAVATVTSVQRLRVSANANFIALHRELYQRVYARKGPAQSGIPRTFNFLLCCNHVTTRHWVQSA